MESEERKIPAADRHLWQFPAVRDLTWILSLALLLTLAYLLRHILLPIFVALLLAYLVNPLVTRVRERWGVSRAFSIILIFSCFILIGMGAGIWAAPLISEQATNLVEKFPEYLRNLGFQTDDVAETVTESVTEQVQQSEEGPSTIFRVLHTALEKATHLLLWVFLVPLYFIFFTLQFQHMLKEGRHYLPPSRYPRAAAVFRRMDLAVGTFFRVRLLICLIIGCVFAFGWWLAQVPYWFLLGAITGVLSIVPYLSIGGWLLALLFKYLDMIGMQGFDWVAVLLWPTVVFAAGNFLEAWVLTPWLHGRTTQLSPMMILTVVLVGGTLGGFWGLLLSIPLAICIDILMKEFLSARA